MVKCGECGLLSIRHRVTRELVELDEEFRATGRVPPPTSAAQDVHTGKPLCTVGAFDLADECHGDAPEDFVDVLQYPRECPQMMPWMPGLTPKEHRELRREQNWAQQQHEWRKEDLAAQRDAQISAVWLTVLSGLLGFVAALSAVAFERFLQ